MSEPSDRKYFTPVDVDWTDDTAKEVAAFLYNNNGKFDGAMCLPKAIRLLGLISDSMKKNGVHLERDEAPKFKES